MSSLDYDSYFADFNRSETFDPAVRTGPKNDFLIRLVYKARQGDRFAPSEFSDTLRFTLRPETWECFQRIHGFRPLTHQDWFNEKVMQYCDILAYEQISVIDPQGNPRLMGASEVLR